MIQESAKTYMGNIEPDIAKKNWSAWMLDETVVQDKGGPNGCTRLWIWTTTTTCKYNDASLEKEVEGVVAKKSKASALDASSFASKVMSGHDRMAIAGFQLAGETEAGNGEKKVLGILDKIGGAARAEGVGMLSLLMELAVWTSAAHMLRRPRAGLATAAAATTRRRTQRMQAGIVSPTAQALRQNGSTSNSPLRQGASKRRQQL